MVESGATVERTVVWPGARVERGASLVESIVAGPVVVRAGARYNRVMITPAGLGPADGSDGRRRRGGGGAIDGKDART